VSVLRWGGVTTVSDSATDRPEFRRAINEAIGWGDRKEVADVYQEHGGRFTDDPTPYEALLAVAQWGAETALTYADHDGLLVTPTHQDPLDRELNPPVE